MDEDDVGPGDGLKAPAFLGPRRIGGAIARSGGGRRAGATLAGAPTPPARDRRDETRRARRPRSAPGARGRSSGRLLLFQLVGVAGGEVEAVDLPQLGDLLARLAAEGGLSLEGVEDDAFQQVT